MYHGTIRNTQSTEEGSRPVSIGYPRSSRGLLLGITSRITPRNKNLYDLTSLSIHFIPPAPPTSISYVYNNGVTATASTSRVPRPLASSRLFLRNNLRQERRIMGHDRFNSTWSIARFPFTASEFAANVTMLPGFFLSFFFLELLQIFRLSQYII